MVVKGKDALEAQSSLDLALDSFHVEISPMPPLLQAEDFKDYSDFSYEETELLESEIELDTVN